MSVSKPTTAVTADVRRSNAALVFGYIAANSPCSRKDIRQATGLVSGTVTTIVGELEARGLVAELHQTVPTAGRPQRLLAFQPGRVVGARVRIRPRELVVGLLDLDGTLLWENTAAHRGQEGPQYLVEAIVDALDQAVAVAQSLPGTWFSGSVIVSLGPVSQQSTIIAALDLPLREFNLGQAVAERLRVPHPVTVFNDGRLGALAEYSALPAEARTQTMAFISSGVTGVAGGVIDGGVVVGGEHGLAGEVGHIVVDKDGPLCACGSHGCLTLYLKTATMLERARGHAGSIDELLALLEAGDRLALEVVEEGARSLAAAVSTLSNLMDVGTVVLGGHLSRLYPWLAPAAEAVIASRARVSPVFNPVVRLAVHGTDAYRYGAWQALAAAALDEPLAVPLLG